MAGTAGGEPVYVPDNDDDLEDVVAAVENETAWQTDSQQVLMQVQMCMLLGCMLLLLLSLIALSWRKWGAVIMRAQHDPKWEAREPSPNSSPTMRASKKQK